MLKKLYFIIFKLLKKCLYLYYLYTVNIATIRYLHNVTRVTGTGLFKNLLHILVIVGVCERYCLYLYTKMFFTLFSITS